MTKVVQHFHFSYVQLMPTPFTKKQGTAVIVHSVAQSNEKNRYGMYSRSLSTGAMGWKTTPLTATELRACLLCVCSRFLSCKCSLFVPPYQLVSIRHCQPISPKMTIS